VTSMSVPIVIGVIGHRDIPESDRARVVSQIRAILESYRRTFPNSPVMVLSALAEGADQVAVEAVRGLDEVFLVAVLPMPVSEYAEDFDGAAKQEFDQCLAEAWSVLEISELDAIPLHATREAAYQDCARFISANSSLLIAVWDGHSPELPGGTADTVFHRVPMLVPLPASGAYSGLGGEHSGTTIHLPSSRRSHGLPALAVDGSVARSEVLELIGGNRWRVWPGPGDDPLCRATERVNREQPGQAVIGPTTDRAPVTTALRNASDIAAGAAQKRFRRLSASLLMLGALGLVLVALQQNTSSIWVMAFALLTVVTLGGLWWLLSRSNVKAMFQQQRVVAEGARVQVVWLEVGLTGCVSDAYLQYQPEVSWIRTLLRAAWLADFVAPFGEPKRARSVQAPQVISVGCDWINDQYNYFAGSAQRRGALDRNAQKARLYGMISLVGLLLAALSLMPEAFRALGGTLPSVAVLMSQSLWEIGLASAAAATAYSQLMAFREVSRRYGQSLELFLSGKLELDESIVGRSDVDVVTAVQDVVREVGKEALQETSSWFATSYDRSVRPV